LIRCTIDYGYDIHHIDIDENTYLAIKRGDKVSLAGHGFWYEGEGRLDDRWYFNRHANGDIEVEVENGAEFTARNSWFDPLP
jgi:hypothetical protein